MRDIRVDTLRGLACIFLVAYHVVGSNPSIGLQLESGFLREVSDLLKTVRMPLFTFLSGMVYAYRPLTENWPTFLKGKARRLLIPMLVVGTAFASIQSLVPGTSNEVENWWLLHIVPVQHFWFVEALFWVFVFIIPFELKRLFDNKFTVATVICFFIFLALEQPYSKYFGYKGFIYLAPFFLFGMSLVRFEVRTLSVLQSFLGFSLLMFAIYFCVNDVDGRSLIGCITGLFGCYFLFGLQLEIGWLAKIGIYSYSIYIFHVFFTAGSRIILKQLPEFYIEVDFLISLILGIVGPIIVYFIANKIPLGSLLLLGERGRKKTVIQEVV